MHSIAQLSKLIEKHLIKPQNPFLLLYPDHVTDRNNVLLDPHAASYAVQNRKNHDRAMV
jgi:hypothetical protein